MTRWITETCQTNGINIHYLRTGGHKPPVVLLHGLTMNGACWTPLAQVLEEDYDVVMPDARGHGKSSAPNQGYSYNELAADVLSLLEVLRLTNPVFLGHSMGGMTAAMAVAQSPKPIQGLILAEPTFLAPQRQQEVYESDVTAQHQLILNGSREDFLTELRSRHRHRSPELIELFVQARFQTNIHAFDILTPPNPDYKHLISTLAIPSLLIIGGVSSVVTPAIATELAKLNQCLKIVQIKEAGHGIPYDQPEHFTTVVKAFLRSANS